MPLSWIDRWSFYLGCLNLDLMWVNMLLFFISLLKFSLPLLFCVWSSGSHQNYSELTLLVFLISGLGLRRCYHFFTCLVPFDVLFFPLLGVVRFRVNYNLLLKLCLLLLYLLKRLSCIPNAFIVFCRDSVDVFLRLDDLRSVCQFKC